MSEIQTSPISSQHSTENQSKPRQCRCITSTGNVANHDILVSYISLPTDSEMMFIQFIMPITSKILARRTHTHAISTLYFFLIHDIVGCIREHEEGFFLQVPGTILYLGTEQ